MKETMSNGNQLQVHNKRFKKIYIEISNICNLQCSFCPIVDRQKKVMDLETFTSILQQAGPLTEEICLHLMGEPLTHPRFAEFIEQCERQEVKVNLTTNGLLWHRYPQELFTSSAFRQINFSLHSFKDNFPQKDIWPYLNRILEFSQYSLEKRPDLYINYRLWNLPSSESPQDKQHDANWEILSIMEDFFKLHLPVTRIDTRWRKTLKIMGRIYLHFDTQFSWPSPQAPIQGHTGFCHGLSSHIGILVDGTVVPCCLDKEGHISLGNCLQSPISGILTGPKAQNILKGFNQGVLVDELCQKCTFIRRFDKRITKRQIKARPSVAFK